MKSNLLALMLLMNVSTVFAGAGSSGGGDPLEISATAFQDVELLSSAVNQAKIEVNNSFLSESMKAAFTKESEELLADNKFRILPSIILVGHENEEQGYKMPKDANQFIALGGMTEFAVGANVYLAERVQNYSKEKLSSVIVHEVLHHVLPDGLTEDEIFVEQLVQSINNGERNQKLQKALELGIFPRKNYISRNAFLKASEIQKLFKYMTERFTRLSPEKIEEEVKNSLPKNLSELTVIDVQSKLAVVATELSGNGTIYAQAYLPKLMKDLAAKINPAGPLTHSPSYGCHKRVILSKCRKENQIKMTEAFSF